MTKLFPFAVMSEAVPVPGVSSRISIYGYSTLRWKRVLLFILTFATVPGVFCITKIEFLGALRIVFELIAVFDESMR